MDLEICKALVRARAEGRPVVLASVIATKGSVPRHAGSCMVIDAERGLLGTIGGGCGEADVIEAAREVLATGEARLVRVELLDAIDTWSPAVCGGTMDIFVEPAA